MKILTINKSSSEDVMEVVVPDSITIIMLRGHVLTEADCSEVSQIINGNEFSFELGDETVTYLFRNPEQYDADQL